MFAIVLQEHGYTSVYGPYATLEQAERVFIDILEEYAHLWDEPCAQYTREELWEKRKDILFDSGIELIIESMEMR